MPTDEQRALWAAIRADPADDTPRLVYADWLQEHGDEPRAEFIRLQCQIAQLQTDSRARRKIVPGLQHRERVLLTATGGRWAGSLFRALHDRSDTDAVLRWVRGIEWRRGFVWGLRVDIDGAHRLATAPDLEPLDRVRVWETGRYSAKKLAEVFAWPGVACVAEFALLGGTDDCVAAVTRGGPTRLTALMFGGGGVTDGGASLLAEWPSGASLATLDLSGNRIGDRGAEALANSPHLGELMSLDLRHNPIGRTGRRHLTARFGGNVLLPPDPG